MSIKQTSLEQARTVARAYRSALRAENPERCARLDTNAREAGHYWVAPLAIPTDRVDEALEVALTPVDIEHLWGIPAATIYGWVSKGLLEHANQDEVRHGAGPKKYVVRAVKEVEARNRMRELDKA